MADKHKVLTKSVENYKLILNEVLGKGSYGKVYKAMKSGEENYYAIKMMESKELNPNIFEMIDKNLDVLKNLQHENIVKLINVLSTSNNIYLIFEYCDGYSLKRYIDNKKLKEEEAIEFMKQLVKGIDFSISQKIIHRDIKPSNILINKSEQHKYGKHLKICDFGFGRYVQEINQQINELSLYQAPEVFYEEMIYKEEYGYKSDIWSLGIIFYEMLHGQTPWIGKSAENLYNHIMKEPLKFDSNISDGIKNIIKKMLIINKNQRINIHDLKVLINKPLIENVGDYKLYLHEELGRGTYGVVYKTKKIGDENLYATKVIDQKNLNPEIYAKLETNIKKYSDELKKLQHENILQLYDVIIIPNFIYLIYEFCDEDSFKEYLSKVGKLKPEEAINFIKQLVEGYDCCILKNIIHRDIKPANILISKSKKMFFGKLLKIYNFGFGRFFQDINKEANNMSFNAESHLYLAPEVYFEKEYDYKCDIWSLGIIFYEMLHGKTPWSGKSVENLFENIKIKPLEIDNTINDDIKSLIKEMLQIGKQERINIDGLKLNLNSILKNIKKIGEYSINLSNLLGKGSYGKVYKTLKSNVENYYATKIMDKSDKKPESIKKLEGMIVKEVDVLKILKHENIVRLFDVRITENNIYLIFEYCDGGSLLEYLDQAGKLNEEEAVYFMKQLVKGLEFCISKKVIHRDIKPANILINISKLHKYGKLLKICDFGFGRFVQDINQEDSMTFDVGSPLYLAPEVYFEEDYGYKCDIWSLGIIFYEMLHGKTPWNGKSAPDLFRNNILKKSLIFDNNIKKDIEILIRMMLEIDSGKRINIDELKKFINKL